MARPTQSDWYRQVINFLRRTKMKRSCSLIAAILMLGTAMFAQIHSKGDDLEVALANEQNPSGDKAQTFTYIEKLPSSYDPVKPEDMRFFTVMTESAHVVKNAPYTANAVTETTQTLGDGNHIVTKTTSSLARDGEGRTRREENIVRVGGLQGSSPKFVTINDPVAHAEYIFQPDAPDGSGKAIVRSGEGIGIGIGSSNGAVKPKVRTFTMSKSGDAN